MKNSIQISLCLKYLFGTLTLALILTTPAISSGIYKWTDENGKVHYASERPVDAQAEKMKLQISEPSPGAEKPEEDKTSDKANPTVDDKANQERVVYCKSERKRLNTAEKNTDKGHAESKQRRKSYIEVSLITGTVNFEKP